MACVRCGRHADRLVARLLRKSRKAQRARNARRLARDGNDVVTARRRIRRVLPRQKVKGQVIQAPTSGGIEVCSIPQSDFYRKGGICLALDLGCYNHGDYRNRHR